MKDEKVDIDTYLESKNRTILDSFMESQGIGKMSDFHIQMTRLNISISNVKYKNSKIYAPLKTLSEWDDFICSEVMILNENKFAIDLYKQLNNLSNSEKVSQLDSVFDMFHKIKLNNEQERKSKKQKNE